MREILLTQDCVAFVDDEDYESVSRFKWHAHRPSIHGLYARRSVGKTHEYLHKFLVPEAIRVDHKDGNGLNNQRENLRICTHQQNMRGFRTKKTGTSTYRGVFWDSERKRWRAEITLKNQRSLFIGRFTTEIDAAKAYDVEARKHFKDFATPNFNPPNEP